MMMDFSFMFIINYTIPLLEPTKYRQKFQKYLWEVTTLDMIKPGKTLYGLFMIEIFYVKIKQK